MEIVVIGGGVGGLAAAAALGQGGHQVRVLERGPRFAQGGPAMRLAPNATAVLDRLGVLDQVLGLGTRPSRAVLRDLGSGAELAELDLGEPLTARYGTPYVVIGRADLLSVLADACADVGAELRADREARAVSQSPAAGSAAGGVVVTCTDGRTCPADLVVGADGPRSVASALVLAGTAGGARDASAWPAAAPAAEGWAAYRGTVPADALAGDAGGAGAGSAGAGGAGAGGAGDEVIAWMSRDAHFTRYPLRAGEVYEQVAVFRSRRYAQLAAGGASAPAGADYSSRAGLPAGDGTPAGAASPGGAGRGPALPGAVGVADVAGVADAGGAGTDDWGGPDELDEAFAGAAPEVRAAVSHLRRDQHWRMLDRPPPTAWASGRVALLGDAAHPMPAYLAQGACQAIEDAAALADALARCAMPDGVSEALAGYAALRAPRVSLVWQARQPWGREPFPRRPADDYAGTDWLYAPSRSLQRVITSGGAANPRHGYLELSRCPQSFRKSSRAAAVSMGTSSARKWPAGRERPVTLSA